MLPTGHGYELIVTLGMESVREYSTKVGGNHTIFIND